ncbi:hypothetical protein LCGC14_3022990 [marine sediment metagenome]|uniref:Uncharacterized protein n=1 Tax=marine sediment metagenome TaxID=412755 RepID=A0A0F8XHS5_9ZZZZ
MPGIQARTLPGRAVLALRYGEDLVGDVQGDDHQGGRVGVTEVPVIMVLGRVGAVRPLVLDQRHGRAGIEGFPGIAA